LILSREDFNQRTSREKKEGDEGRAGAKVGRLRYEIDSRGGWDW
jgi:hypothetical protein